MGGAKRDTKGREKRDRMRIENNGKIPQNEES